MISNMEYFNINEFDSPDEIGSGKLMNEEFLQMLVEARRRASTAFNITSGYRTPNHNLSVGGVLNSSHTKGMAADIKCNNSAKRSVIVKSLLDAGFTRIGIANNFIHVDNDSSKVQNVIWVY
tara:strand:- start:298 stop:663 length:366 start_codon:yes stop_codon:yes gene_type:complete